MVGRLPAMAEGARAGWNARGAAAARLPGARRAAQPAATGGERESAAAPRRLRPRWPSRTRSLLRDLVSVLAASAVVLVARASFADHYLVPSGSMEPTVQVGDQICVNKAAYGLRMPGLGDVPRCPARARRAGTSSCSHRRRTARCSSSASWRYPGDVVEVSSGGVSIDGVASAGAAEEDGGVIEELGGREHALSAEYGGGPDFGPTRVPDGSYLVLGDNRGNSRDGRYFGWVARAAILGRAVAVCLHDGTPGWHPL